MAIISNIRKTGQKLNLNKIPVTYEDRSFLSDVFILSEYNPKFTAGKNTFLINGARSLAPNAPVQIEVLDINNNSLYVEIAKSNNVSYTEGGALRVAVYVYNDTPFGVGSITIVSSLKNGNKARWTGNIQINPTVPNTSKVIFYKSPLLNVQSSVVPISSNSSVGVTKIISGSIFSTAVQPRKGEDYGLYDTSLRNIDYRITINEPTQFTSASMKNIPIDLYISQLDDSPTTVNITSSNVITDIVDSKTIKLKNPIYHINNENKKIVSNITDGNFRITVTDVVYNSLFNITEPYKQSVAVVNYKNLKTFCGNVYRHKLYRRSLSSAGDFEIIADEPLLPLETLVDTNTSNSYFRSLGNFPNDLHVTHYWFSSSNNIAISRNADILMDGIQIINTDGNERYIIVKNDSTTASRDAIYVPYVAQEILDEKGTSYDSNFMSFFGNVPYKFSFKTNIIKSNLNNESSIGFYITSSMIDKIGGDIDFNSSKGLKVGEIILDRNSSLYSDSPVTFYNNFSNDFYGTMVIYTKNCTATISSITLSTYSEPSFSPEIFVTHTPFPVSIPGEQFELKAELFDLNSNLVYSDLHTISTFDISGSSLNMYIPGISNNDVTNGVTFFNVIISSSKASLPYQGLTVNGKSVVDITSYIPGSINNVNIGDITAGTGKFSSLTVPVDPVAPSVVGPVVVFNPAGWLSINGKKVPYFDP